MGQEKMGKENIAFLLRMLHNQIRLIIHKSAPKFEKAPKTQLQGGIMGYLYHHQDQHVYQRDIEKEFRISRATATNTLQVMEREGFVVRRALDKDGRLKRIQLTEEACLNHRQVEAHIERMDRRMLKGMSEADADELRRLLRILYKNLEEMAEELSEELMGIHSREMNSRGVDSIGTDSIEAGSIGTDSIEAGSIGTNSIETGF